MAAPVTPGSLSARCTIAKIVRRASAGVFFTRLKSNSVMISPAALKPGLSPAALRAPRKNNPAAKSSMSESDLRHDRNVARRKEAAETSDTRRLAYLFFEVFDQIGLSRFERRTQAKEQRRDDTE